MVVAEVYSFAERITRATREIRDMIKTTQQGTHTAVATMEEGVKEVAMGTGKAAGIERALEGI